MCLPQRNIQQRACTGFSPVSLFIAAVCKPPLSGAKIGRILELRSEISFFIPATVKFTSRLRLRLSARKRKWSKMRKGRWEERKTHSELFQIKCRFVFTKCRIIFAVRLLLLFKSQRRETIRECGAMISPYCALKFAFLVCQKGSVARLCFS